MDTTPYEPSENPQVLARELPEPYLAGVEVPDDLHDDLFVLVGGLVPRHHHLCRRQVLQLIDLRGRGRDHPIASCGKRKLLREVPASCPGKSVPGMSPGTGMK